MLLWPSYFARMLRRTRERFLLGGGRRNFFWPILSHLPICLYIVKIVCQLSAYVYDCSYIFTIDCPFIFKIACLLSTHTVLTMACLLPTWCHICPFGACILSQLAGSCQPAYGKYCPFAACICSSRLIFAFVMNTIAHLGFVAHIMSVWPLFLFFCLCIVQSLLFRRSSYYNSVPFGPVTNKVCCYKPHISQQ